MDNSNAHPDVRDLWARLLDAPRWNQYRTVWLQQHIAVYNKVLPITQYTLKQQVIGDNKLYYTIDGSIYRAFMVVRHLLNIHGKGSKNYCFDTFKGLCFGLQYLDD